jgi:[histone H4]-lysine20 N-methyltransferase SETD8
VTTRNFSRGEFVIEYIGDLISMQEANERESRYAADDNTGCYMYYFKHNEQQYWYVFYWIKSISFVTNSLIIR